MYLITIWQFGQGSEQGQLVSPGAGSCFHDGSVTRWTNLILAVGWEFGCGFWPGASVSLLGLSVQMLGLPWEEQKLLVLVKARPRTGTASLPLYSIGQNSHKASSGSRPWGRRSHVSVEGVTKNLGWFATRSVTTYFL